METGCKWGDECEGIEVYGTYDNEDAARVHAAVVEKVLCAEDDTNLEVRCYQVTVPIPRYSIVPNLGSDGRPND